MCCDSMTAAKNGPRASAFLLLACSNVHGKARKQRLRQSGRNEICVALLPLSKKDIRRPALSRMKECVEKTTAKDSTGIVEQATDAGGGATRQQTDIQRVKSRASSSKWHSQEQNLGVSRRVDWTIALCKARERKRDAGGA